MKLKNLNKEQFNNLQLIYDMRIERNIIGNYSMFLKKQKETLKAVNNNKKQLTFNKVK